MKHYHSIIAVIMLICLLFTACGHKPAEETTVPSESTETTVETTDPSNPSDPSETTVPSEETTAPSEGQSTELTDNETAKPDQSDSEQAKPDKGGSDQTKPNKPSVKPTQPKPTKPTEPKPTKPSVKPTKPTVKPTEPKPTKPSVKPTQPAKPTEAPVYYHDWHFVEEQGHNEVVQEAYDETVTETVYESHVICNGCGRDFTAEYGPGEAATNGAIDHCAKDFWDECEGYHTQRVPVEHETRCCHTVGGRHSCTLGMFCLW